MELLTVFEKYLGWCPNAPVISAAPAVLVIPPESIHPAQSGEGGSGGGSGRVRNGIGIAISGMKEMLRDRGLFWFTAMAGFVMLSLIVVEEWAVRNIMSIRPFLFSIHSGDSFLVIDTRLFLIEIIFLSCFTILLAGLVRYRTGKGEGRSQRIREAFNGIGGRIGPLATLSVVMALSGTFLNEIISQSQFLGKIFMTISMAVFYLPYAYYIPDPLSAAIYISVKIMVVNIFLFLVALYVVPVIVVEQKGLVSSFTRSFAVIRKTWQEFLGCVVVFGAIVMGTFAVALVIGQSPFLLDRDFDFFINMSRGQPLMMIVCFLFLTTSWLMMAAGFTAAGIAITDLYSRGTGVRGHSSHGTSSIGLPETAG